MVLTGAIRRTTTILVCVTLSLPTLTGCAAHKDAEGAAIDGASGAAARKEAVGVRVDMNAQSGGNVVVIEPSQIIKASPEFVERAGQWKEESQRPLTGLLDTDLDIEQEDGVVSLLFSVRNISEGVLRLDFDLGREYDFFVADAEGKRIYRWSHGRETYLPAITHKKLKKGEETTFRAAWNYEDNGGHRVPPGEYTITVQILARLENRRIISPDELTAAKDVEVKY